MSERAALKVMEQWSSAYPKANAALSPFEAWKGLVDLIDAAIAEVEQRRRPERENIAYFVKCAAFNQPLMGVDWANPSNQRWLDAADQIIAALQPPSTAP